jgi:DNA-3-methyladenine glycosylase II
MTLSGGRKLPYDSEAALAHLRAADPKLGALIDKVEETGGFTLKLRHTMTPFAALLQSILYQQLHGKAAASIHERVLLLYGTDVLTLLDTPDELLRAAGVSGNKVKAFKDLAAKTLDGTVPDLRAIRKLSDEEVIERLTEVRGIGTWTVEMLLMFRLGRPDVLPVTDYGVRKGFALTFQKIPKNRAIAAADLPKPEVILKRARRWQPYRTVASWYMWRACDLYDAARKTGAAAKASAVTL